MKKSAVVASSSNKQLQRTVTRHRGDGASARFHYALAPRFTRQRAAAELRRYAQSNRRRMKYCPLCRSELSHRNVDGRTRLGCSAAGCQFVHWENPIPVVASLVRLSDSYVLARNAKWPSGLFSFLTGFIENGEAPESAAVRETQEELGVRARSTHLIGHFPLARLNQLIIAYEVRAAGELTLGDEIAEVKVVSPTELATFDFGPLSLTSEIVSSWLQREHRASA